MNSDDILDYWYSERMKKHWFSSTPQIDQEIKQRYESLWQQAAEGKLDSWQECADGSLALSIILDQFPLNMFRGEARSFSTEQKAVAVSLHAIDQGFDKIINKEKLAFLLMPLMHSENLQHQDLSVEKFKQHGLSNNLRFAEHHREIVRKYGRFPHRNKILGRESSQAEIDYLASEHAFKG